METFRELTDLPEKYRHCALCIGKFDGIHLGHAAILAKTVGIAKELGAPAVAFTFDPTPVQLLRPENAPEALYDREQKIELFEKFGLDALILFRTTREFLKTTALEFFNEAIVKTLDARALIEGYNFYFGKDAEGGLDFLASQCSQRSIRLEIVDKRYIGESGVSSSRIRELISTGRVEEAGLMLGRPYELRGVVRSDAKRGRRLNCPTANLWETTTLLPQEAVYAAAAVVDDGTVWPAAVNLGPNPTFDVDKLKIEAHLLDYCGDLYDRPLRLRFLVKLRDIIDFRGDEARLMAQMNEDIARVREIFARYCSLADK